VGTGYSFHISHSPSVKARCPPTLPQPAFCEYEIQRNNHTRVPLVLSTQLR
jgi:hypothetical protein